MKDDKEKEIQPIRFEIVIEEESNYFMFGAPLSSEFPSWHLASMHRGSIVKSRSIWELQSKSSTKGTRL